MKAGDNKTIEETVRFNCIVDQDDTSIGIMYGEIRDYICAARANNRDQVMKLFHKDILIMKEELVTARPLSVKVYPRLCY